MRFANSKFVFVGSLKFRMCLVDGVASGSMRTDS